jgi:type VI secretion system protein ImpL
MKALLKMMFGPLMLRVLGALAVAALIWFAGPLVSIAQWRPLDPSWARALTIAIVLVAWFGRRIAIAARDAMRNRAFLRSMSGTGTGQTESAAGKANRERFEQALKTLERADVATGQRSPRWLRRDKPVYRLPWYLLIGPPGSGKTTVLTHSGLRFPLAGTIGQDPLQGIGGTRNCQWWFTDEAVLIDTAGRYTTQDSDPEADAAEWQGFLSLLKKYRPRQPINGVLLTIGASDLLQAAPGDIERHATLARARLDELSRTLGVRFPVYLLVTKCDLLAGFTEFFEEFDRDRREQVWGMTFPFDPARTGADRSALDAGLARLSARLHERVNERLHTERSLQRRAPVFGFPNQFALLQPALVDFVERSLSASTLSATPILRGVYFTSGTQEGSPIDRLLGGLGRAFGLGAAMPQAQRPSGRAYFITRLLSDIVFRESSLAGTNLDWERRVRVGRWVTAGIASAALLGAGIAWTVSYLNNRDYLRAVDQQVASLSNALATPAARDAASRLPTLLPMLDAVRDVASTPAVRIDAPPAALGWGLFQGPKLGDAASAAYRRMLADALGPALSRRIEDLLRQRDITPELLYETLKAYVMLHDRAHLDATALKAWVAFDAQARLGGALDEAGRRALASHVDALLERESIMPDSAFDTALVERVRRLLGGTPFPNRVVDRIKRGSVPADLPPFRITQAAGNTAQSVFTRTSGAALGDGVPALFTYDGYHRAFQSRLEPLLLQLAQEETWVLGVRDSDNARRAADPSRRSGLADEVRGVFLREYASTWESFIADIGLVRPASLEQSIQIARVLSAADSPLPPLLRAIVREVSLTEKPAPSGAVAAGRNAIDKATEAVRSAQQDLMKLMPNPVAGGAPPAPTARPIESIVDERFEPLRRYVRAQATGQPAPIDSTMTLLADVYQLLVSTETALRGNLPPPASDVPVRVRAESARLPEPVRGMVGVLSGIGTNQALAAARGNISQSLSSSVGEYCLKAITDRYPFQPDSPRDVTPDDFSRLFAAGGALDEFFQKNLAAFVDTSSRPWTFRRQGEARMSDSTALMQFQRAEEIRRTYFPAGARSPAFRFEIRPVSMDAAIMTMSLDVDGQILRYAHGPIVPTTVSWPGPKGTGQVRLHASGGGSAGNDTTLTFEGPWALFRMFDRGQVERTGSPERFRIAFDLGGRRLLLEVTSSSVQNPYRLPELQAFRCPTRL